MDTRTKRMITATLTTLALTGTLIPTISSVKAYAEAPNAIVSNQLNHFIENFNFIYISKLSTDQQFLYKSNLKEILSKSQYQNVNWEHVALQVDAFAGADNGMPLIQTRASFFDGQGITVDEMGAAINVAIGIATGGTAVFLGGLAARAGRHAAKSIIRSVISRFFGAWVVKEVFIDYILDLTDPGRAIARHWDANDAYPNNGRINF